MTPDKPLIMVLPSGVLLNIHQVQYIKADDVPVLIYWLGRESPSSHTGKDAEFLRSYVYGLMKEQEKQSLPSCDRPDDIPF